ncbi:MAG: hypothetical protein LKG20_00985 [Tetrasphaera jenkinsii]|jgi:hypothetical protein|nr:hypothetical protein [Tetrasphaera jenkinsii]
MFGRTIRGQLAAGVPVLGRGKHSSPRRGACFMEFASYLAGERWSDRPRCTHPLLAQLARLVNDGVDDEHRAQLVPLIPDVVGLNPPGVQTELRIVVRAALAALPVANQERQNALAYGLAMLDPLLSQLPPAEAAAYRGRINEEYAAVPAARRWGAERARRSQLDEKTLRDKSFPVLVQTSVRGLAEACVDDYQERMVALLRECIAEMRATSVVDAGPTYGARPLSDAVLARLDPVRTQ